jgi:hypothetical protein
MTTPRGKEGGRMNQNERAMQDRPFPWNKLPSLPTMATARAVPRQVSRFYRGTDGTPWIEVKSDFDRSQILQRPARPRDRERWAREWSDFEKGEAQP